MGFFGAFLGKVHIEKFAFIYTLQQQQAKNNIEARAIPIIEMANMSVLACRALLFYRCRMSTQAPTVYIKTEQLLLYLLHLELK